MAEPIGVLSNCLGMLANSMALYRTISEKKKEEESATVGTVSPGRDRELEAQTKIHAFALVLNPVVANALQVWRTTVTTSLSMAPVMLGLSLMHWGTVKISGTPVAGAMLLKTSWWLWIGGGLIQVFALNYETAKDNAHSLALLEEVTAKIVRAPSGRAEMEKAKDKQNAAQEASRRGFLTRSAGFALVVIGILLFGVFISMNT